MDRSEAKGEAWPELVLDEWKDTCATLHLWTQIAGKVRMALSPFVNHWWHVPLYAIPRGLTTSKIPHPSGRSFELVFDLVAHSLDIHVSDGRVERLELGPRSVAELYRELMAELRGLGLEVKINTMPQELPDPVPFELDDLHAQYDREAVERFRRALLSSHAALERFRADFLGKSSPAHFFWGSFDLAVTRFSGRRAPPRPGADLITREAYSHEVHSVGWWPGNHQFPHAAFYAYMAPEPAGFASVTVRPRAAFYHPAMKEWLLPYDEVRRARDPAAEVVEFCQSTYAGGATLAGWDRPALERPDAIVETTMANGCDHKDQAKVTTTDERVCPECVKLGSSWVHLRMCVSCGQVGCCDSSPHKHATAHHRKSKHPLARSIEPGETWVWCYEDEVAFDVDELPSRKAA